MITILHGEDTTASRNYYFDLKQKHPDAIVLDGVGISQTDLQQQLSGQDLFGATKSIFIENLLSKRKPSKELDSLIYLVQLSIINNKSSIIMWESKELTTKQISGFKNANIKLFKIPSTIFAFLDGVKPKNGKQLIELFHKTLQDKDPEFVLFMLQRQMRTLLAMSSQSSLSSLGEGQGEVDSGQGRVTISEVSRLAPWQKRKVEKQAKMFSTPQLINLHSKLFQLELDMKTGGLSLPLAESMDMLLVTI